MFCIILDFYHLFYFQYPILLLYPCYPWRSFWLLNASTVDLYAPVLSPPVRALTLTLSNLLNPPDCLFYSCKSLTYCLVYSNSALMITMRQSKSSIFLYSFLVLLLLFPKSSISYTGADLLIFSIPN